MAHYYLETESGRNGDSAWPLWGLAMSLVVAVSRLFPQLPTRFHSFAPSLLFSSVPAPSFLAISPPLLIYSAPTPNLSRPFFA